MDEKTNNAADNAAEDTRTLEDVLRENENLKKEVENLKKELEKENGYSSVFIAKFSDVECKYVALKNLIKNFANLID